MKINEELNLMEVEWGSVPTRRTHWIFLVISSETRHIVVDSGGEA